MKAFKGFAARSGILSGCFSVLILITVYPGYLFAAEPRSLSSYDPEVKALLATMTLDEKIGQMIQAESRELKGPEDVEKFYLGSILSGGNDDPKAGNSLEAWTDLYDSLQRREIGRAHV